MKELQDKIAEAYLERLEIMSQLHLDPDFQKTATLLLMLTPSERGQVLAFAESILTWGRFGTGLAIGGDQDSQSAHATEEDPIP